jgi:FeS assembly SUF system protein
MKRVNVDVPSPEAMQKNDSVFEQLEQNAEYAQQKIEQNEANGDPSLTLEENVIAALKEIYDPEISINIYDLGLIYKVDIDGGTVEIDMTLTTPGCPVAHSFPGMVENTVSKVPGVDIARVELVWDPPWTQESLTDEARLQLGLM